MSTSNTQPESPAVAALYEELAKQLDRWRRGEIRLREVDEAYDALTDALSASADQATEAR